MCVVFILLTLSFSVQLVGDIDQQQPASEEKNETGSEFSAKTKHFTLLPESQEGRG